MKKKILIILTNIFVVVLHINIGLRFNINAPEWQKTSAIILTNLIAVNAFLIDKVIGIRRPRIKHGSKSAKGKIQVNIECNNPNNYPLKVQARCNYCDYFFVGHDGNEEKEYEIPPEDNNFILVLEKTKKQVERKHNIRLLLSFRKHGETSKLRKRLKIPNLFISSDEYQ